MTIHNEFDLIRRAEDAAGVNDDNPWEVGDLVTNPEEEKLPSGTVLIDRDGDPWKLEGEEWFIPGVEVHFIPYPEHGPYEVVRLPGRHA